MAKEPTTAAPPAAPQESPELSLGALAARVDEIEAILKRAGLMHVPEAIEPEATEEAQA